MLTPRGKPNSPEKGFYYKNDRVEIYQFDILKQFIAFFFPCEKKNYRRKLSQKFCRSLAFANLILKNH